ncbi:MAG: transposase [Kiritimatiellia bacterium]|jgi:hypothetical protein
MTDPGALERALKLVNAYAVKSGRWLGSERAPEGTNKITTARTLIGRIDLEKQTALLDALHTNAETARQIVQEKGGDYVLTVKGNAKTLRRTLTKLQVQDLRPFSPSAHGGGSRGCCGTE